MMSYRRPVLAATALVFLSSAFGCDKKAGDKIAKVDASEVATGAPKRAPEASAARPAPSTAPASDGPDSAPAAAKGQPKVALVDAGREPRRELRVRPQRGDAQQVRMVMHTAMEMKLGELANPPTKLPPIAMTLAMTVEDVTADGDIRYRMAFPEVDVLDAAGVLPKVREAMATTLRSVEGLSGSGVSTSRGFNKGVNLDIPAGTAPQIKQILDGMKDTMNQVAALLPAEAVGVGAQWDVELTVQNKGITVEQKTRYELVSLQGERMTIKSVVAQSAPKQKFQNPAVPSVTMDLLSHKGRATGKSTLDLTQIFPSDSTSSAHVDMSMAFDAEGKRQTMSVKMAFQVEIKAK
jgi:hypothetical protein